MQLWLRMEIVEKSFCLDPDALVMPFIGDWQLIPH